MRNKLTIGAFLLMLTAFIVVLALPADEESIKSENRVMATIPPVNEETVFSGEFETGFESLSGIISLSSQITDFQNVDEKEDLYRKQVKLFPQIKI